MNHQKRVFVSKTTAAKAIRTIVCIKECCGEVGAKVFPLAWALGVLCFKKDRPGAAGVLPSRLNPTQAAEEEQALDHSTSCVSMKWVLTSRWVARSRTRWCKEVCSRSSASGRDGWQRGRYWRPRKARCKWRTTSQNTYRRRRRRRKSSPKNWRYDESKN